MLHPATLLRAALAMVALVGCAREDPNGDEAPAIFTVAQERLEGQGQQGPSRAKLSAAVDATRRTAIVEAANRVAPAVVTVHTIHTEQVRPRSPWESFFLPPNANRQTSGLGSGFITSADGIVLTNDHVVSGADRIMVTLSEGRDLEATLVGSDPVTDVAVLRVDGENLPVTPLGTSEGLLIGEWVVAIGNPFGNLFSNSEPTVTTGVVSATGRHIIPNSGGTGFHLGMIQTDASINPGNSGDRW